MLLYPIIIGFLTVIAVGSTSCLSHVQFGKTTLSRRDDQLLERSANEFQDNSMELPKTSFTHTRKDDEIEKSSGKRIFSILNEEQVPGIRAYGLPKKILEDNGEIDRIKVMTKPSNSYDHPHNFVRPWRARNARAVSSGVKDQDLEGQDSKVFRPLFVYRQQQAAKRRLHRQKPKATTRPFHPMKHY